MLLGIPSKTQLVSLGVCDLSMCMCMRAVPATDLRLPDSTLERVEPAQCGQCDAPPVEKGTYRLSGRRIG